MLAIAPDSTDAMMEVAYAQNSLGSLEYENFEFSKSIEYFSASLKLKQYIAEQNPDDLDAQLYAADTLSWIASATVHNGEYDKALKLYETAEKTFENLYISYGNNAAIIENFVATMYQKALLAKQLKYDEIRNQTLERAYSTVRNATTQDVKNSEWQFDLASIEVQLLLSDSELKSDIDPQGTLEKILKLNKEWLLFPLIEYFQSKKEWEVASKILLHAETIRSKSAIKTNLSFTEYITKTKYLLAKFVQGTQTLEQAELACLCRAIDKVTTELVKKSSHPEVTMRIMFTQNCLNPNVENKQALKGQIAILSAPYYFNFLKKE